MGLDGLSIGNLGLNRDKTSKENSINAETLSASRGVFDPSIDQLGKKEAVTTEDHDNPSFSGGSTGDDEEEAELNDTYEKETDSEDLVESWEDREHKNYKFVINNEDGVIYVTDQETNEYVTEITIEDLSKLVKSMKQPNGIIVNRKI